jgi:peroxiredoxin
MFVPSVDLMFRESGEFVPHSAEELFKLKRVVLFSLPGAFTPTCSAYQLPGFEEKYSEFISKGIDAIYCVSVNDSFVMNAWGKSLGIEKVKLIPDGNGEFTSGMNMLVSKFNVGFAYRSWRYAAVIDNCLVEKLFVEPGKEDNCADDPYVETTPDKVLEYVTANQKVKVTA